jgi:hypothetical protein
MLVSNQCLGSRRLNEKVAAFALRAPAKAFIEIPWF